MITGFVNIKKDYSENQNFWDLNPLMINVDPFRQLYSKDKSKNKEVSSKHMWCIVWMSDPDEEVNKYYRVPLEERLEICKNFNKDFSLTDKLIEPCLEKYPYLCLSADELAYKQQKDQLIEISKFLSQQEISFDTVESIIKLKSMLPKIYADFEKVEKLFIKTKSENRIHGGRKQTVRERGGIVPTEE